MKTVRDILKKHLMDKGFDGLVENTFECGCDLHDLIPCDLDFSGCKPAYKVPDKTGEYDYRMTTKKPKS